MFDFKGKKNQLIIKKHLYPVPRTVKRPKGQESKLPCKARPSIPVKGNAYEGKD